MDLRLEAYFREVDNPWTRYDNLYNRWVLLPELQGDRYLLEPEHAQTLGFEASVTANRSARWSLNGSYALADATEQVQGSKTHRPWQQKHTLKAGLRWQSTRWHFGLATHYRSGWPVTGLITDGAQLPARINGERLPSSFSLDTHIGRHFVSARGDLEIYLDITNLSNHQKLGGYTYELDGDRDNDALSPLLPLLGLSWHS